MEPAELVEWMWARFDADKRSLARDIAAARSQDDERFLAEARGQLGRSSSPTRTSTSGLDQLA